jgi:DNA ligase-1
MIDEVMLAESIDLENAKFPYLATPKIDGIRCYIDASHLWARSNQSIPNLELSRSIPRVLPDGIDGELFCGNFRQTQSIVTSPGAIVEGSGLTLHIFDWCQNTRTGYLDRISSIVPILRELCASGWVKSIDASTGLSVYSHPTYNFRITPLLPVWITDLAQLQAFYEKCLGLGHEGIILRCPLAHYKFGRATLAENSLLRLKPTHDRKAIILGVEEQLSNQNEAVLNELGRTSRSTAKAGLVPSGTLGSFYVMDIETEVKFNVGGGPGLTHIERSRLWQMRHELGGKVIEYRSLSYGVHEKPRHPQFLGLVEERKF